MENKEIKKIKDDQDIISNVVYKNEGTVSFNSGIEDRDYIKVVKNTKGYNWEIKLVAKPNINLIDQIAFVNQQMVNKFGVPVTGAIYDKVGEIKKC